MTTRNGASDGEETCNAFETPNTACPCSFARATKLVSLGVIHQLRRAYFDKLRLLRLERNYEYIAKE